MASAQTLGGALPLEFQSQLLFQPDNALALRVLPRPPVPDGYSDEWPEPENFWQLNAHDDEVDARLLAATSERLIHLFIEVVDGTPVRNTSGVAGRPSDAVRITLRTARGMQSWNITPGAPGPLRVGSSVRGRH